MPTTTSFEFGDVVLVPFPFTDQSATKRRPAIVVSSALYNENRPDVVIIAVTSQTGSAGGFADTRLEDWRPAGLLKPSVLKPLLATVSKTIVLRRLGHLSERDHKALRQLLSEVLG